jgi:hypothetical protein
MFDFISARLSREMSMHIQKCRLSVRSIAIATNSGVFDGETNSYDVLCEVNRGTK